MRLESRPMLVAGALLAVTAFLGTALLGLANWHSKPLIADNKRQALLHSLQVVMPAGRYDNDILSDTTLIDDPELLRMPEPTRVYRARMQGRPVAVAFRILAPDGYAGDIDLLMGVDAQGDITAVRVINHHETPGLGDEIEAQRSDWIHGFAGKSIDNPGERGWHVKRDGGDFDQFTGATITPRAVVGAVKRGLLFFKRHREQVFSADLPVGNTDHPGKT